MRIAPALFTVLLSCATPVFTLDKDCPGTALDRAATFLSDFEQFKTVVRTAGYTGRVVIRLKLTEEGEIRNPQILFPAKLTSSKKILDEVRAWRFCPAVRFNRYHASETEFHIDVEKKQ
jgi:hypothetical protein